MRFRYVVASVMQPAESGDPNPRKPFRTYCAGIPYGKYSPLRYQVDRHVRVCVCDAFTDKKLTDAIPKVLSIEV
jgi:hypothetical protein